MCIEFPRFAIFLPQHSTKVRDAIEHDQKAEGHIEELAMIDGLFRVKTEQV